MPSTVTYDYHYKDVYDFCAEDFQKQYSQKIFYEHSVFAQGHDALFSSDFFNKELL